MSTCNSCGTTKCTCSNQTTIYKSYSSITSDCGCEEVDDCCVDTKTSCVEYNGEDLTCVGLVVDTDSPIDLNELVKLIDERICGLSDVIEACCSEESTPYDLSLLEWTCLLAPTPLTLENVLNVLIAEVEARTWTFNVEHFIETDNACDGVDISINTATITSTVVNEIINNYITTIVNSLEYNIFPNDGACAKEFIADGFVVESGSGLSLSKQCFDNTEFTFTFNSTSTIVDTFVGYVAPNGIRYDATTPIALSDTAAIITWFADELGLVVTITPYAFPVFEIKVNDYGSATYAPQLVLNLSSVDTTESYDSLVANVADNCCKILISYDAGEDCCDECPEMKVAHREGFDVEANIVTEKTTSVTISVPPVASSLTSIVIKGIEYTPTSPILFSNQAAIEAFFASITLYNVSVDYTAYTPNVTITIVGYWDLTDTTFSDGTNRFEVFYNQDDGLGTIFQLTEVFPEPTQDVTKTCTIYGVDVFARPSLLSTSFDAAWTVSSGLDIKREGNKIYITGGYLQRVADVALDGTTIFSLPAAYSSENDATFPIYITDTGVTYTKVAIMRVAAGGTNFVINGLGAGITGHKVEFSNMVIFLENP